MPRELGRATGTLAPPTHRRRAAPRPGRRADRRRPTAPSRRADHGSCSCATRSPRRPGPMLSGRTPGIDLSEKGGGQAEALGERLAALPIAAVYASPIERTTQTAAAHRRAPRARGAAAARRASRPTTASGPAARSPTSPRPTCGRTVQRRAVARALPRRRVDRARCRRAWSPRSRRSSPTTRARSSWSCVARRPDQGRDRALHRHAPRPVPAHRRVAGVGHRVRASARTARDAREVQRHRRARRAAAADRRSRRRRRRTPTDEEDVT